MDNELLKERFELAMERIGEMTGESTVPEPLRHYFRKTAGFILTMEGLYHEIQAGHTDAYTLEQWKKLNHSLYQDILPEHYDESYGNPDYAVKKLGETYGKLLCFLYSEIRAMVVYAFEQRLENLVILAELFIEVYNEFEGDTLPGYRQIQQILYWFESDYSDVLVERRTREGVDPSLDFAVKIIMDSDLTDLRYLYRYGEYVSDQELATAKYLNELPEKTVKLMTDTFTEGYRMCFVTGNKDLSKKTTVNIRYQLGFERMIRRAIENFEKLGLKPVIFRAAPESINRRGTNRIGYFGGIPNRQYDYDHREDGALYLDKNLVERKLGVIRTAYEDLKDLALGHAGPACVETFGEEPFLPKTCDHAFCYSEKQQKLSVEYSNEVSQIVNRYIKGDERGFTIIAFPVPAIGENFREIFGETIKMNTLDYEKYKRIQQSIIDALDQGEKVHILGKGENHTDLTVALLSLADPEKETLFENCLADANIPVGEVFTSPKLSGTNGVLEVGEVFLNGLCYQKLHMEFCDGMVTSYSCGNFETEEENQSYIRQNVMFHHDTLPLGEFAIGTNTVAYAMAEKFQIARKLPVLIAEKMGPHFAVGDTCYSWAEDIPVKNPDGKEVIARDNQVSLLRKEDPSKAYFGCHTDITIPYKELDSIRVIRKDGTWISIIEDGRFVLPGTEELNEPLDMAQK